MMGWSWLTDARFERLGSGRQRTIRKHGAPAEEMRSWLADAGERTLLAERWFGMLIQADSPLGARYVSGRPVSAMSCLYVG